MHGWTPTRHDTCLIIPTSNGEFPCECRWVFQHLVTRPGRRFVCVPVTKTWQKIRKSSGGGVQRLTLQWNSSGASQSEIVFSCVQGLFCRASRTTQVLVRQLLRRLRRNYSHVCCQCLVSILKELCNTMSDHGASEAHVHAQSMCCSPFIWFLRDKKMRIRLVHAHM